MTSMVPGGSGNTIKPLDLNIAEGVAHGVVTGLKSANSSEPPESTTQRNELAQKQSGAGKKIGEFFKSALRKLGGGALIVVGIPIFVATVLPAVVIGAIVKDLAKDKNGGLGPDKTSAAGALTGLVAASILIILGGGMIFPDH